MVPTEVPTVRLGALWLSHPASTTGACPAKFGASPVESTCSLAGSPGLQVRALQTLPANSLKTPYELPTTVPQSRASCRAPEQASDHNHQHHCSEPFKARPSAAEQKEAGSNKGWQVLKSAHAQLPGLIGADAEMNAYQQELPNATNPISSGAGQQGTGYSADWPMPVDAALPGRPAAEHTEAGIRTDQHTMLDLQRHEPLMAGLHHVGCTSFQVQQLTASNAVQVSHSL